MTSNNALSPAEFNVKPHLLPWMLSVNDPAVAGYVPNLKKPIAVSSILGAEAILKRESAFKKIFGIKKPGSLMHPSTQAPLIQGLYTIGSVGTISQTALSDCDIWICINKGDFKEKLMDQLSQKVYLIKDLLDANLKLPVYNFNFGALDKESCGSAQRNVLKEEFYRTMIMIAGKIPLWWLCCDPRENVDYQEFCDQYNSAVFEDFDCIDMGALDFVNDDEYFGAALWQFNKALTHPLKSIIKMLLLKMILLSSGEELLCNRFRNKIMNQERDFRFVDPSMFTMEAVLHHCRGIDAETLEFIKKCFYMRYEMKFYSKNLTNKEIMAKENFLAYPMSRETIDHLNAFHTWPLLERLEFGGKIFVLLVDIYKDITASRKDSMTGITPQDMSIIGRKLSVCLEKKKNKVPIVHKPIFNLNLPTIIFIVDKKVWHVFDAGDTDKLVISSLRACITPKM
jgi:adenylate cyclase class 1